MPLGGVPGFVVFCEHETPPMDSGAAVSGAGAGDCRWARQDARPATTRRGGCASWPGRSGRVTPEEQELAHQAESLADHAVDLAFADALRQAADEIPEQTPELKALAEAKQKAQAAAVADEERIKKLAAARKRARQRARPGSD